MVVHAEHYKRHPICGKFLLFTGTYKEKCASSDLRITQVTQHQIPFSAKIDNQLRGNLVILRLQHLHHVDLIRIPFQNGLQNFSYCRPRNLKLTWHWSNTCSRIAGTGSFYNHSSSDFFDTFIHNRFLSFSWQHTQVFSLFKFRNHLLQIIFLHEQCL